MARFTAVLTPVSHGGHYVAVPESAGLKHGDRVRGTVNGAAFRSNIAKYSGVLHMGIHQATLRELGVTAGDRVKVVVQLDTEPLPGDVPPADLKRALKASKLAKEGYEAMAPSHRREHVKHVLEAKRPETRAKRVAAAIAAFEEHPCAGAGEQCFDPGGVGIGACVEM